MTRSARARRTGIGVVLSLLPLMCTACSDGVPDDRAVDAATGPYSADLRAAKKKAASKLQREILDDLQIERFEYEEAVDAYVSCMRDRGVDAEAIDQAGYYIYKTSINNDAIVDECRVGTIDLIESIYINQLTNPQRQDYNALMRACLIRHHVVGDEYTAEDYKKDELENFASAPYDNDDEGLHRCFANASS